MTQQLIRYDAAVRALAECKAVDEVKDWRRRPCCNAGVWLCIAKDKAWKPTPQKSGIVPSGALR